MDKIEVTLKTDTSKLGKAIESLGEIGRVAIIAGGALANLSFSPGVQSLIIGAIEKNQLLEEIAFITKLTTDEVREFYQSHSYSLEFIKVAMQAGAELNEESIKQTMIKKHL